MGDVAASANDPIFLNHRAMVDCIFETWLQKNPTAQYPVNDNIPNGHQQKDYIVPFFPLYRHRDMFSTADKFGYRCKITPVVQSSESPSPDWAQIYSNRVFCNTICRIAMLGMLLRNNLWYLLLLEEKFTSPKYLRLQ